MINSSNDNGLLPAGLSDVLYPNAELQSKTIENLIDAERIMIFTAVFLEFAATWLMCFPPILTRVCVLLFGAMKSNKWPFLMLKPAQSWSKYKNSAYIPLPIMLLRKQCYFLFLSTQEL